MPSIPADFHRLASRAVVPSGRRRRVAVVGSGIAGLSAASQLAADPGTAVTLFEGDSRFGGHAHTVDVTLEGQTFGVDTGFLVFNQSTYPRLTRLFDSLGVATAPSEMSFSVQSQLPGRARRLEWSGRSLASVFAQRSNLARPAFWRMLADIARFNRLASALAVGGADAALAQPIGEFLDEQRFSVAFRDWYLLPMVACIWSCPTAQMLHFPLATLIRFCHNHGLLQVADRPQWHTVAGGSRNYVRALLHGIADTHLDTAVLGIHRTCAGALLRTRHGSSHFDAVVLACHSDQALALLGDDATRDEREVLGAIRYHRNRAVLHTDSSLLPRRRAAWNYERASEVAHEQSQVCLHYWLNRLQPLPWRQPVLVSLNPLREPAPQAVLGCYDYAHPVFDGAAIAAQRRLAGLQGQRHSWFCGAWTGYGFHEDGLRSGIEVAQAVVDAAPRAPEMAWAA